MTEPCPQTGPADRLYHAIRAHDLSVRLFAMAMDMSSEEALFRHHLALSGASPEMSVNSPDYTALAAAFSQISSDLKNDVRNAISDLDARVKP